MYEVRMNAAYSAANIEFNVVHCIPYTVIHIWLCGWCVSSLFFFLLLFSFCTEPNRIGWFGFGWFSFSVISSTHDFLLFKNRVVSIRWICIDRIIHVLQQLNHWIGFFFLFFFFFYSSLKWSNHWLGHRRKTQDLTIFNFQ